MISMIYDTHGNMVGTALEAGLAVWARYILLDQTISLNDYYYIALHMMFF
jgi:hypothetical protein